MSLSLTKVKAFFGLAGIDESESSRIQHLGEVFYWVMLLIIFWLPIQSYLEFRHVLLAKISFVSDWIIWAAFFVKVTVLTSLVKRKAHYLVTNWMTLLVIVCGFPLIWIYFPQLANIKFLRLLLFISIIVPWLPVGYRFLSHNNFGATLFIAVVFMFLSGILISTFDSGIKSPLTGIWWAWETFSTVGYGDVVPTTFEGKVVAIIIMVMSACLYSLLTANFSAFLIKKTKKEDEIKDNELLQLLKKLETKIEQLEKCLNPAKTDKQ